MKIRINILIFIFYPILRNGSLFCFLHDINIKHERNTEKMSSVVSKSHFLKKYRNDSMKVIMRMHPEWDKEHVKRNIDEIIIRDLRNPPTKLENSYTHEERDTHLVSVFDWAMEEKPIIAANGTFFKQHKDAINPNAKMVDEFLNIRARIKKEMFALEDESSRQYKMKDLAQGNEKRLANS